MELPGQGVLVLQRLVHTAGRSNLATESQRERGETQSLRADLSLKAGSWFLLGPVSDSAVGSPNSASFSDLALSMCFISAARMEAHLHLQITRTAVLGEKLIGSESLTVVLGKANPTSNPTSSTRQYNPNCNCNLPAACVLLHTCVGTCPLESSPGFGNHGETANHRRVPFSCGQGPQNQSPAATESP